MTRISRGRIKKAQPKGYALTSYSFQIFFYKGM